MRLRGNALAEFRIKIRDMRLRGVTLHRIAQMTGKHHTTILYHLDDDRAMLKRAAMRHRSVVRKRVRSMLAERAGRHTEA